MNTRGDLEQIKDLELFGVHNLFVSVDEPGKEIILDAICELTDMKKLALALRWKNGIERFDRSKTFRNQRWEQSNSRVFKLHGPSLRILGDRLRQRAVYPLALAILEPLMKRQEAVLDQGDAEIACTLDVLGTLYCELALYDEAKDLLYRALRLRERTFCPDDLVIAKSISHLANVYVHLKHPEDQDSLARAEELYRRAMAILEMHLGEVLTDTAECLLNLVQVLSIKSDPEATSQSEIMYCRVLAIAELARIIDHPFSASRLKTLVSRLRDVSDPASIVEAESL